MSAKERLSLRIKLSYGLGEMAEGVKSAALETFLFFYYVQLLGLSGSLTGLALLIAVLIDAVSDPLIGHISDNLRNRLGRRHPFLYFAPIPLGISMVLLFAPPAGMSQFGLFLWLLVFTAISRLMQSCYFVPHMALGADLAQAYSDRVAVSGWRNAFAYLGRLLVLAIAFPIYFHPSDAFPNGQLDASAYAPLAITCAAIAGGAILISAIGTQRKALAMEQSLGRALDQAPSRFFHHVRCAFRLRAFAIFFFANLVSYVLSGVQAALGIHMMTYYWRLPPQGIQWALSALTIGVLVGSLLVRPVADRWDKKQLLVASVIASVAIANMPIFLAEGGVLPLEDPHRLTAILFGFLFLAGVSGGAALVLPGAMLADIADAYEHRFGGRIEGFLYGASAFTRKAALGLGGAMAGIALDLIHFPRDVSPAAIDRSAAFDLALIYGPAMLALTIFAMMWMWKYPLSRERHDEILADLSRRRNS